MEFGGFCFWNMCKILYAFILKAAEECRFKYPESLLKQCIQHVWMADNKNEIAFLLDHICS